MHFDAQFKGIDARILLDTGSSMMAISEEYVRYNQLQSVQSFSQQIELADGTFIPSTRKVAGYFAKGNYRKYMEFAVVPINEDIILGLPWCDTVVLTINLQSNFLQFYTKRSGCHVTHRWYCAGFEDPRSNIQLVSSQQLSLLRKSATNTIHEVLISPILNEVKNDPGFEKEASHKELEIRHHISTLHSALTHNEKKGSIGLDTTDLQVLGTLEEQLAELLREFTTVFHIHEGLPQSRPEDMKIETTPSAKIPFRPLSRLSPPELDALKLKLEELLAKGWIQPSKSPYGASVLFVKKKDGGLRMCVDYRALNNITVKDRTPLPSVTDLRERVKGAKYKTTLDIRDAFHNIRICPTDTHKTAFRTRYGHFEFTVCPFGACNSPATFVRMMNRIFGDLYDSGVIAYVDDLLIYSDTYSSHLLLLREVLQRLDSANLKVKLSKCEFAKEEVTFCGMILHTDGVSMNQDSVDAICEFPQISCVSHIQSFIGSIRFFQDYIPNLAEIAGPLFDLTKKNAEWNWNEEHQSIVRVVQYHLTSAPLLRFYDPKLPTEIHTDASAYAIGGWLGQKHSDNVIYPVAYWSRRMIPAERNYPVHEQELLAMIEFIKHHRRYLHGIEFTAFTDHKALEHLQTQPHLSARQVRWLQVLQEYTPKICFTPGELNGFADWLSRRPDFMKVECPQCRHLISNPLSTASLSSLFSTGIVEQLRQEIIEAQRLDEFCIELHNFQNTVEEVPASRRRYLLQFHKRDEVWCHSRRNQVVIPKALQLQLLEYYHDDVHRGHYGVEKTLSFLRKKVYWKNMNQTVKTFIQSCDICQRSKQRRGAPPGKLHPLPVPTTRFQSLAMDFCFVPVDGEGKDSIWIIIDRLTKLVKLIPCSKTVTASELADMFFTQWYCRGYGLPKDIVSDMDSKLVSGFWNDLCKRLRIQQNTSTARHQRTDGQSEITVQIVKQMLIQHVNYTQDNWRSLLPSIEFAINNSVNSSTIAKPFYLAHAFEVPDYPLFESEAGPASTILEAHTKAIVKAKENMFKAQQNMAKFYDKKRSTVPKYRIGDEVLLLRKGIKWDADITRSEKLLAPWLGPFVITDVDNGRDNVELDLPARMQCHRWFHVEVVRPYTIPDTHFPARKVPEYPEPDMDDEGAANYEVESILDSKKYRRKWKFLVKFLGYPETYNQWEPEENLEGCTELLRDYKERHPEKNFT